MKQATHPATGIVLTFDARRHTYTDDRGERYTSVTGFVKRFFAPFDAPSAAARVAARTGQTELELMAGWKAKGAASADSGTDVHAYAEALILGTARPAPRDARQRQAFGMVEKAIAAMEKTHEILAVEQIVFDPLYLISGTMDIAARNRQAGTLSVLDWKTCESITEDAYGRVGLPPIDHVPDSKVAHYTLQLSTYARIMQGSGYIGDDEPVALGLIHLPHVGFDPVFRPLNYERDVVDAMIEAHDAGYVNRKENQP